MEARHAGADVGALVPAGEAVDAVLPQVTLFGRGHDRLADDLAQDLGVRLFWIMNIEKDAAGVLAEGLALYLGQADVLLDDLERVLAGGALGFLAPALFDGV